MTRNKILQARDTFFFFGSVGLILLLNKDTEAALVGTTLSRCAASSALAGVTRDTIELCKSARYSTDI